MLYEFHRKQNSKKPGSVHATYLITGTRKQQPQVATQANGVHSQESGEDGDTVMQSSPPLPSSSAPQPEEEEEDQAPISIRTVLLVKEERLEQAKATFERIMGIHVYSLAANGLSDVQSLTECNRKIAVTYASEDPLQAWKQYGTIQNPNVKRRTQRRQPPAPAPDTKSTAAKTKPAPPTTKPAILEKEASKESRDDAQDSKPASKPSSAKATPEPAAAKKPAQPKRQASNIFKSFAKTQPPKAKKQDSQGSASASPAPEAEDDVPMNDFSDEEPDADDAEEADAEETSKEPEGQSKKDRQKALEAMMEQEDEVMEDAAPDQKEEAAEHDAGAIDKIAEKAEEPKEEVNVENGRRRGRRRVIKKKTVKDEDGYLGKDPTLPTYLHPTRFLALSLTPASSDPRRSRLGILLRRRARAEKGEDGAGRERKQAFCWWEKGRCEARAGKHHELLCEEVSSITA